MPVQDFKTDFKTDFNDKKHHGNKQRMLIGISVAALLVAIGSAIAVYFALKEQAANDVNLPLPYQVTNLTSEKYPEIIKAPRNSNVSKIPKLIWTFWHESPPVFVRECIKTWEKHASDHSVIILNKNNLQRYITKMAIPKDLFLPSIKPAWTSDWIRLAVVYEHGGIWMDASTILTNSIDFIHGNQTFYNVENYFFYQKSSTTDMEFPHYESYIFASIKHSIFIKKWLDEFNIVMDKYKCADSYLTDLEASMGSRAFKVMTAGIYDRSYLKVYVAYKKVMFVDGHEPSAYAFAAELIPFRLSELSKWNDETFVNLLTRNTTEVLDYVPPIIKIISSQREALMKFLNSVDNLAGVSNQSIYHLHVHPTEEIPAEITTGTIETEINL